MQAFICRLFTVGLFLLPISPLYALTTSLPFFGTTIGHKQTHLVQNKETLAQVARRFNLGMGELLAANPKIQDKPLIIGQVVQLPTKFKLPVYHLRKGIVINLTSMRVFYFHPDSTEVSTYPIAIGKQGWETPRGKTTVVAKVKNTTWYIPQSIAQEADRQGIDLPDFILPGPNNPLGQFAIRLGFPRIMLHGTNAPATVGLKRSHGCMRMYPEDIEDLFGKVAIGTAVNIMD